MEMVQPVLFKPIREIVSSNEFLDMVECNNFNNLHEIVQIPVHKLLQLPNFGYRMLNELITILEKYGLEDMLRED